MHVSLPPSRRAVPCSTTHGLRPCTHLDCLLRQGLRLDELVELLLSRPPEARGSESGEGHTPGAQARVHARRVAPATAQLHAGQAKLQARPRHAGADKHTRGEPPRSTGHSHARASNSKPARQHEGDTATLCMRPHLDSGVPVLVVRRLVALGEPKQVQLAAGGVVDVHPLCEGRPQHVAPSRSARASSSCICQCPHSERPAAAGQHCREAACAQGSH